MEIGIVARPDSDRAAALVADVYGDLVDEGVDVAVATGAASLLDIDPVPIEAMRGFPLVVSVGGDGTFLYATRHVGPTPILGVNLGEVGFLNAVSPDEAMPRVLDEIARIRETGQPQYREVARLDADVPGGTLPPALNEIAVLGPQRGRGHGLEVEVVFDGSVYSTGHADGVLVATQTGSTAYNLSEGGPLLHPSTDALVVTLMCGASPMPPLVVGLDKEISVGVRGTDHAVVASDGERLTVETPNTVGIRTADEPARIAGPRSDFIEALAKIERPGRQ